MPSVMRRYTPKRPQVTQSIISTRLQLQPLKLNKAKLCSIHYPQFFSTKSGLGYIDSCILWAVKQIALCHTLSSCSINTLPSHEFGKDII